MRRYNRKILAVFGTVIIHLIAGIIFMSFKLSELHTQKSKTYEIEYIPEETRNEDSPKPESKPSTVEGVISGDRELMNIARNLANKPDIKIDRDDYINNVKDEMIRNGQLGKDNYIDDQKKAEVRPDEAEDKDAVIDKKPEVRPEEKGKMIADYKGPTRIYYDLKGRNHLYLPIPIYKCQGSGIVAMYIDVNQKGEVEKVTVIEAKSTTSDPCLVETATNSALASRFNADAGAARLQRGTLTYQFVAQ